jgi:Mrp family chromosome partitioning ATPase/capsular polysaccharide biosynthesis protein
MIKHPDFHDFAVVSESLRDAASHHSAPGGPQPMDLAKVLEYIRRHIRLIIECVVIGGGLSAATGLLIGPTFTAVALLAVAEPESGAQGQTTESAVDTQIAILQSPAFMDRAFRALSADPALKPLAPNVTALQRRVKFIQASKSRLIVVSLSAKSPVLAAQAVNRIVRLYVEDPVLQSVQSVDDVTKQYVERIKELETQLALLTKAGADANLAAQEALRDQIATLKLNENLVRRRQESRRQTLAMTPPVQLVALANPPTRRSSLNPLFIAAPGALFSALFGIGLAITIGRLDKRIYTREQLEALVRRRCAGEVPPASSSGFKLKKAARAAQPAYARAIEALVTQTLLLPSPRPKFVLLAPSEADPNEGQIVADFAAAAARVTPRVLLVDLDISRVEPRVPLLQRVLGRGPEGQRHDVFDVLAGRRTFEEAVERKGERGYFLLPLRSPVLDDPFSLLASDRLSQLFDALSTAFDLILISGPPMAGMHETQIISAFADAAVLFVRSGATREPAVLEAVAAADQSLGQSTVSGRARLWPALVEARARVHPPGLLSIAAGLAQRGSTERSVPAANASARNTPNPKSPPEAKAESALR